MTLNFIGSKPEPKKMTSQKCKQKSAFYLQIILSLKRLIDLVRLAMFVVLVVNIRRFLNWPFVQRYTRRPLKKKIKVIKIEEIIEPAARCSFL